ncbi:sulfite exporter TauE/SafE family protein [Alkalihalobacillus sp. AL-G]|uniref:sulfite exporter TauE/SafE family protein n=1 Tax=Alkalihalobacillus sp. AL-G TaxID=2926399 RepID=UPI00272A0362|nr:sulfite exporter TauE/SafE family protein [Alkalihalobacillus sp. AL-G]WLD92944.1 sulfite exporter TauE/SafE family protein [Alkalihalobacillus sp. AL-G]
MELLYIILGFAVGILSGYFGIGGGFILTPILMLIGYSPIAAITMSLMYAIGSSASGVFAHFKMKNVAWKTAIILGISGVTATQLAKPIVLWLDENNYDETVIPVIYAMIIAYFAYSLLKKDPKKKQASKGGEPNIVKTIIIGFIGGFLSSALGVGGGFVMVPLLISLMGFESRKAVGTSLVSVFLIVIAGFLSYAVVIEFDFIVALLLIAGALFGGQIGAKLTGLYSDSQIKTYFGLLYVTTLISILLELFNLDTAGIIVIGIYFVTLLGKFIKDILQRKHSTSAS